MPSIREVHHLPYSCDQMFALVADVRRYPEFLPWVVATRIRSESESEMEADMVVGFKSLREKFTSRVHLDHPNMIEVQYIDGPMRDLDNIWKFHALSDSSCEIEFFVSFAFKNRMFEAMAGQYFDRAFRRMVDAFEKRADALYGSKSSSAHNVA